MFDLKCKFKTLLSPFVHELGKYELEICGSCLWLHFSAYLMAVTSKELYNEDLRFLCLAQNGLLEKYGCSFLTNIVKYVVEIHCINFNQKNQFS